MCLTAPDRHTVVIHWSVQYGDFLFALTELWPLPLHVYATRQFVGIYNPRTGAYNSTLAQALPAGPSYDTTYPVDDGPFTVQSFVPQDHVVLVRNLHFCSSFFHRPALDQITLVSAARDFPAQEAQAKSVTFGQMQVELLAAYRKGGLDDVESLRASDLPQLRGIPALEVITSPSVEFVEYDFNQRTVAPNAGVNGGTSMFTDPVMRRAFVQAFDRCAAVRALLVIRTCTDPNLFTDELTAPPAPD